MDERSTRIFIGLCLLVLVWIGVYWMWQPTHEQGPVITFEPQPRVGQLDESPPVVVSDQSLRTDSDPVVEVSVEPSAPILIPPEFTEHIVGPNELMQSIAKYYFGSIDDWTIIAKANPTVDPRKLKPGMTLMIPKDKGNIQGRLVGLSTEPGVITPHTQSESKTIEYVVQSGDSLSRISQRIYGSSRHAQFIFESNRDILRSMDSISIGQLLKLPPLPEPNTPSSPGG